MDDTGEFSFTFGDFESFEGLISSIFSRFYASVPVRVKS